MIVILVSEGCVETLNQRPMPFKVYQSKGLFGGNLNPCPHSFENHSWNSCFGTITFLNGDKYIGEWDEDKKNGFGTLSRLNGDKYFGEWDEDKKDGQGTLAFSNGDKLF